MCPPPPHYSCLAPRLGAWLPFSALLRRPALGCSVLGSALFHEPLVASGCGGVVIVRDIEFASTSEADLLPFYGRCHIGYVPSQGVVLGLSKVARLARMYARRLQTQERFTQELLQAFEAHVHPQVTTHAAGLRSWLVKQRTCTLTPGASPCRGVRCWWRRGTCRRAQHRLCMRAARPPAACARRPVCRSVLLSTCNGVWCSRAWRARASAACQAGNALLQEFLTLLRLHAPAAPLPSADCTRSSIALQAVASNGCECSGEHLAREASVACQSGTGGLSLPAHKHMERAVESILCEIGEDPTRPVRALAVQAMHVRMPCLCSPALVPCACDVLLSMTRRMVCFAGVAGQCSPIRQGVAS